MFRIFVFAIVAISTVWSAKNTDVTINPVCTSEQFHFTKSIYWEYRKSLLYYIGDNKLVTCDPITEEVHSVKMDNVPKFIQPSEDPDCVLIGLGDTVQSVQWDGISETVGEVQTIATIDEGDNTVIIDASVSFDGNLTLIVHGLDANGSKTCSIYGMKTDGVPSRINVVSKPYTDFVINHIQWNCTYAYLTGNESRMTTTDNKFYNNYGFYYRSIEYWNELYSAEGSAVGETNDLWQIMNYKNNDNAEIFKLITPSFFIEEYIVLPIKRATYLAYGNEEMNVLYVTTKKNESDTDANAGGIYKVEGIGVTGLPKYIALPEGTEVNYCSNPLLSTTTIAPTTTTTTTTTPEPTTTVATTPATTSTAAVSTTSLAPTTAATSSEEDTTNQQGDKDDFCNCYFKWMQYYNFQYNVNVQASYRQAQVPNGASQTGQIETNGASQTDQVKTNDASQTDQIKTNGGSQTDQIKTNGMSQTDQIKPDVNKVADISKYLPTFCLDYVKYFSDYIQNYQEYVQQYSQANQQNYQDYSKYGQGSVSGNVGDSNDYYKNAMKIVNCIQQKYNYNWNAQNNWG